MKSCSKCGSDEVCTVGVSNGYRGACLSCGHRGSTETTEKDSIKSWDKESKSTPKIRLKNRSRVASIAKRMEKILAPFQNENWELPSAKNEDGSEDSDVKIMTSSKGSNLYGTYIEFQDPALRNLMYNLRSACEDLLKEITVK